MQLAPLLYRAVQQPSRCRQRIIAGDRRMAAVHEGGHAVVAAHFGINVVVARIFPYGADDLGLQRAYAGHTIYARPQSSEHCRLIAISGLVAERVWRSRGATTLDSWLIMAGSVADEVHKAAHSMADEDPAIENGDRVPVHFVSIEDLELLLVKSTEGQFFETLQAAARPEYRHWLLPNVRQAIAPALKRPRSYILKHSISQVIPWWDAIGKLRD